MTKLLSIIIPSYNMEHYLPHCLDSVLGDESVRSLLDVIVVNDGSKDRTGEIAADYAERYPDVVRVIDKPNGHYGSAVNAGLAAANGLFVKNLDADDSFAPSGLSALLAQVESDRQAGMSIDLYLTAFDHVDEQGNSTHNVSYALPTDCVFGLDEILSNTKEISMHACTWRVDLLRKIGYRQSEGIAYSDVEWILYPMLETQAIRYLPIKVYRYLFGRVGQSVSLAARRRNTGSWEVILGRILLVFRSRGAELQLDAREYLLRVAVDMARMLFEAVFILEPVANARIKIPRLLLELESAQVGLSARLENEARVLKGSLNVPYLRIWRRLPVGKTVWVWMIRGYLVITRWVK